ncbi:GSU2403 family nucleotidyltransferase fold protein [Nocardia sp. NPDC059177]|uniref:GSU2403 family nucleotidyltransferase fold protein n=1 Tax=Nocardia sp. NPDC059177 TaxID=3346759 RepID=UPI0036CA6F6C
MSRSGVDDSFSPFDLQFRTRTALLDALDALAEHRAAVIVVGAQAVYMHTGDLTIALPEMTKDSDVAINPLVLRDDPRLEVAMTAAGFVPNLNQQPGSWVNPHGIPVDLMVPEYLAGPGGRQARSARIPPHGKRAARRARGLEAALIDHREVVDREFVDGDTRALVANVAGPAALIVAKCHKIAERIQQPSRLNDKDAHDVYRLLAACDPTRVAESFAVLLGEEISRDVTTEAVTHLSQLFAAEVDAVGAAMAGRAEEGFGEPEYVSRAVCLLARELLAAIEGDV